MENFEKFIKEARNSVISKKQYLDELLTLCTEQQLNMFNLMYPNGPTSKQYDRSIEQIKATILGLNKDVERLRNIEKDFNLFKKESEEKEQSLQKEIKLLNHEIESLNNNIDMINNHINIENAEIQERLAKLDALEQYGVDNWEWYDDAINSI
jgi:chromosome segregation ATPase